MVIRNVDATWPDLRHPEVSGPVRLTARYRTSRFKTDARSLLVVSRGYFAPHLRSQGRFITGGKPGSGLMSRLVD